MRYQDNQLIIKQSDFYFNKTSQAANNYSIFEPLQIENDLMTYVTSVDQDQLVLLCSLINLHFSLIECLRSIHYWYVVDQCRLRSVCGNA